MFFCQHLNNRPFLCPFLCLGKWRLILFSIWEYSLCISLSRQYRIFQPFFQICSWRWVQWFSRLKWWTCKSTRFGDYSFPCVHIRPTSCVSCCCYRPLPPETWGRLLWIVQTAWTDFWSSWSEWWSTRQSECVSGWLSFAGCCIQAASWSRGTCSLCRSCSRWGRCWASITGSKRTSCAASRGSSCWSTIPGHRIARCLSVSAILCLHSSLASWISHCANCLNFRFHPLKFCCPTIWSFLLYKFW